MLLILILIIGYILVRKSKEIIWQYNCLDDMEIRAFMTGQLRKHDAEYRRAVAHLGLCEKCQQRLIDFDDRKKIEDHLVNKEE